MKELLKLKFKQDFRNFKKNEEFIFYKDINLLVGDQGSGKSSILQILTNKHKDIVSIECDKLTTLSFDFEKDNPRISSYFKTPLDIHARFQSHGQTMLSIINSIKIENCSDVLIMDEPDTALSIRSIYKLINKLKILHKNNKYVILSSHNPYLISAFKNVLSLDHKKWITSKEFIESQLK